MQYSRSLSDVRRWRLASLLLLGNRLLILAAASLLLVSFFTNDQNLMVFGSILVTTSLLSMIAHWFVASNAGCPLCGMPVLAPVGFMKHRKARCLLGSYKLRVALCIMFKERFRCPYCNEDIALEVRGNPGRLRHRLSGMSEMPRFR